VQATDPAGDPQGLGGVGEVQAGDGGDPQPADFHTAMPGVAGAVGDGDVLPGRDLELVVERGLVSPHHQDVGAVLSGDQPVGTLALGVERIGSDNGVGEVQAVQQRPEAGDLVGGVVDVGLGEDRTGGGDPSRRAGGPASCCSGRCRAGLAVVIPVEEGGTGTPADGEVSIPMAIESVVLIEEFISETGRL
jgi:hypothetical protein